MNKNKNNRTPFVLAAGAALAAALSACGSDGASTPAVAAPLAEMSFFVTSSGSGRGGDLGGLDGADRICATLAQAAGAPDRSWRAYLSTQATAGQPAINARDRIGAGPWRNARGELIAGSVAELHAGNNLTKQTAVTERGEVVPGVGDTPVQHDILTGSQADGTAFATAEDRTCGNWTRGGAEGTAFVGHSDRRGLAETEPARSWNASHLSRGCSQEALRSTGGAGQFYCFATR